MRVTFTDRGWSDFLVLQKQDAKLTKRLHRLIEECRRHPFEGIGRPEPLKNDLGGWWSRRLTDEHRLVYRVTGSGDAQVLEIAQCRFHY